MGRIIVAVIILVAASTGVFAQVAGKTGRGEFEASRREAFEEFKNGKGVSGKPAPTPASKAVSAPASKSKTTSARKRSPDGIAIAMLSPDTSNVSGYNLRVCVNSDAKIDGVSLLVNGRSHRGVTVVDDDGCDYAVNQTVALLSGANSVEVRVTAAGLTASETFSVRYGAADVAPTVGRRAALVIGNASYSEMPLKNARNDAEDIAAKLRGLEFEVTFLADASKEQMERAIDAFGNMARNYEAALFYYSGHGIQHERINYLIPADAGSFEESDVEFRSVSMNRVMRRLDETGARVKIVMLDACRNNPFERAWRSGSGGGLAQSDAPSGTLISYATAPGRVAIDGVNDRNSPYTAEVLKWIDTPGLAVEKLFKNVREGVQKSTGNRQTPWESTSMTGDFYFRRPQ